MEKGGDFLTTKAVCRSFRRELKVCVRMKRELRRNATSFLAEN